MRFQCTVCGKFANLAHQCPAHLINSVVPNAPARPRVATYVTVDGMIVRRARAVDLPVLAAMDDVIFGVDAWDFAGFVSAYRDARTDILVMSDGLRIVGYGMVEHRKQFSHVTALGVDASMRGRGLGEVLLNRLIARARARRVGIVKLEVRSDNPGAKALYDKSGFTQTGVKEKYYADRCSAIVMRKDIAPRARVAA